MGFYLPYVKWDGPTAMLHLRMIDGAVCLFDDQGRMIKGVRSVTVEQNVEDAVRVSASFFVSRQAD